MSFNIFDTVKGFLTPDLISKASSFLGENESDINKALSGILPAVLSGMVAKASSGNTGATEVFNMAKETHHSGLSANPGNLFGGSAGMLDKGMNLINGLFGDKSNNIISTISFFSGLRNSSVSSLFSMTAPIAAGTLGKYAVENNMNASGLAFLLSSQKNSIRNMLPGALTGIVSTLGMGNITDGFSNTAKTTYHASEYKAKKRMNWFSWFLPLIIIAVLSWWFLFGGKNGCSNAAVADKDTVAVSAIVPEVTNPAETESFKIKLPDGSELDAYKGVLKIN